MWSYVVCVGVLLCMNEDGRCVCVCVCVVVVVGGRVVGGNRATCVTARQIEYPLVKRCQGTLKIGRSERTQAICQ